MAADVNRIVKSTVLMFALATFVGASSCNLGSGFGGKSRNDEVESKNPKDGTKPTDDSEGIPGYLVDPNLIAIARDAAGGWTVKAGAGAVRAREGASTDGVRAVVYSGKKSDFSRRETGDDGTQTVPAERLASIAVKADGSFATEFPVIASELIYVAVGGKRGANLVPASNDTGVGVVTAYVDTTASASFAALMRVNIQFNRNASELAAIDPGCRADSASHNILHLGCTAAADRICRDRGFVAGIVTDYAYPVDAGPVGVLCFSAGERRIAASSDLGGTTINVEHLATVRIAAAQFCAKSIAASKGAAVLGMTASQATILCFANDVEIVTAPRGDVVKNSRPDDDCLASQVISCDIWATDYCRGRSTRYQAGVFKDGFAAASVAVACIP